VELVVFVGLQASGKSTFFRERFAESHQHVSKDLFPNNRNKIRRQEHRLRAALSVGRCVVVDNTNPTLEDRRVLIGLGGEYGARIVGYFFDAGVRECIRRNEIRESKARVPGRGHLRHRQEAGHPLDRGALRRASMRAAERLRLRGPRVLRGAPGVLAADSGDKESSEETLETWKEGGC